MKALFAQFRAPKSRRVEPARAGDAAAETQKIDAEAYRHLKRCVVARAFPAVQRAYEEQREQVVGLGHWGSWWGGYQLAVIFYPPRERPIAPTEPWPNVPPQRTFWLGAEGE